MPDWKSFVRERLNLSGIEPLREAEIIEEVSQQLQEAYQESLRNGAAEEEARCAAEQHIADWSRFAQEISRAQTKHRPSVGQNAQDHLEALQFRSTGWRAMTFELFRDVVYGGRMLRKHIRLSVIAVLTIALGIAATAAIFSLVNGVILQPLPYDHADRIVWVWGKFSQGDRAAISPPDFVDFRAQAKSFESFAAMHVMHQFVPLPVTLNTANGDIKLDSAIVTAGFFEVFGVKAILGRTFSKQDEKPGSKFIVLSHSAWQHHFGSDPHLIGKSVRMGQSVYTIIGVLQKGFRYPLDVDVWASIHFGTPEMSQRQFHFLRPIARMGNGVVLERAQVELQTIAAQLEKQYPESNRTWTVAIQPLHEQVVGRVRKPLLIIFAAVIALMLIACVNVANLLLARTTARQKELAIRVALGARRGRILRQLFAETLVLAIPAAILGLLLAYWSLASFKTAASDFIPRLQEVRIDTWTVSFVAFSTVVCAILISLAPAFDVLPRVSAERLKEAKYSGTRTGAGRLRHSLAIVEIALSLVLLAGAGLLLKSFWNLTRVDPGFTTENLLTVRLTLDEERYPSAESVIRFVENATETITHLPGVESVSAGSGLPLLPAGGDRFFTIEGRPLPDSDSNKPNAQFRAITQDYFETLSIPLIRGRSFSSRDNETSPKVVVINEAFARQFFPSSDALGKFINIDLGVPFRAEIIGVVKSTRQSLAERPDPEMYLLHKQSPMGYFLLAVKSRINAASLTQAVHASLLKLDKDLNLQKFRTMEEIVEEAGVRDRLNATLLGTAAGLALILAAIGIYGVLSFSVEQRQQEIGVRMALGASRREILLLILRSGVWLSSIGLLLGIAGAIALTRLMRSLLFEVSPSDPVIFASVSLFLFFVAVFACWVPANRATRIDPLLSLRYE